MKTCIRCKEELSTVFTIFFKDVERFEESSYQWLTCEKCDDKYMAKATSDKFNVFDDRIDFSGYRVKPEYWKSSLKEYRRCKKPNDVRCKCKVHKKTPPMVMGEFAWSDFS